MFKPFILQTNKQTKKEVDLTDQQTAIPVLFY